MVVVIKNNWFVTLNHRVYLVFISHIHISCSALVLDSYAHDQSKVEAYGIQVVKDLEAFLQIASKSITITPCPYKVYISNVMHTQYYCNNTKATYTYGAADICIGATAIFYRK